MLHFSAMKRLVLVIVTLAFLAQESSAFVTRALLRSSVRPQWFDGGIAASANAAEGSMDANKIFCNRELSLSRVEAVGFDMDYTLAEVGFNKAYRESVVSILTLLPRRVSFAWCLQSITLSSTCWRTRALSRSSSTWGTPKR